jgi:hypothetical protein
MEIVCYRNEALSHESRTLPADTYNLAHALLSRSPAACVFLPIRSMQYLAIIDIEEIVFLDGERKCWVDISWRDFAPHTRSSLLEPVAYQAVFYHSAATSLMTRLPTEFHRALVQLDSKGRIPGTARVLKFPAPHSG